MDKMGVHKLRLDPCFMYSVLTGFYQQYLREAYLLHSIFCNLFLYINVHSNLSSHLQPIKLIATI